MMRFHKGPSLPPMNEKRPRSVAELQRQCCPIDTVARYKTTTCKQSAGELCKQSIGKVCKEMGDGNKRMSASQGLGAAISGGVIVHYTSHVYVVCLP